MAVAAKDKSAAKQRQKDEAPVNYWRQPAEPLAYADEVFRFFAIRQGGHQVALDQAATYATWTDEDAVLRGELTITELEKAPLDVGEGERIRCDVNTGGKGWRELWTMRIQDPPSVSISSGERTYALADDLALLARSTDSFKFVKSSKGKPGGWPVHDAIREVASRYHLPVQKIAQTKFRIKRLVRVNVSPISMLATLLRQEEINEDRLLMMRMDRGELVVEPLQRSRYMLVLSSAIVEAMYTASRSEELITAATARAVPSLVKGKDKKKNRRARKKKIWVSVIQQSLVKQFGYIHRNIEVTADTPAEAKAIVMRRIARVVKLRQELTITHPGISSLRRGHAIRVILEDIDVDVVAYVGGITFTVGPGDFSMSVTVNFADPFEAARDQLSKLQRAEAAARRKRKADAEKKANAKDAPKGEKTDQHSEKG